MNLHDFVPDHGDKVLAWLRSNYPNFLFEIRDSDVWEVTTMHPEAEWHRSESIKWWARRIDERRARGQT